MACAQFKEIYIARYAEISPTGYGSKFDNCLLKTTKDVYRHFMGKTFLPKDILANSLPTKEKR